MYKVVIVDDEPIIVRGLCKSIDWESAGCSVVGTAFGGEEGIRLIREKEPDIIFSDIRMQRLDGLTMIAAVKSEFPNAQITILTGYRDFEYAQTAIRLGVVRFLLKPSKMEELQEAITFMTGRLDKLKEEGRYWHRPEKSVTKMPEGGGEEKEPQQNAQAAVQEEELADSAANSFVVKNAIAYIEEHYQEKLKLSDVADQVYVSQWHLSKLLNKYQGQNFSEILNGVRIARAKEMLRDPSLRIGDVADMVGFLDMAHFSRVFKKMVGISANEYRNQL